MHGQSYDNSPALPPSPHDKKASPPAQPKRRAEGEVSRIKRSVYD
ncbi:hypothetical protein HMPREF3185_00154 [Porphyromonas somerae]|uniref:Uncharacterized protein n=1 Tax=Porphyromonas somerae TaxID=322095 RepID=A0A134BEY2_9PORP|nr:hypothetical protein HMPREF3184_00154 [Porphyromonadaceae bacterium KA00676]KXB78506.1 hypothetical protein HMPREF3185_00154 [Porphyromonas somerae]